MPNLASVLKEEIARLTRKEIRAEMGTTVKASAQYRRDIAALKRQVTQMQRQVSLLEKQVLKEIPVAATVDPDAQVRFTANGLKSQRKRLSLSAAEYGLLVGVSAQSIYNWERGVARPRKEQVATLAAMRGMGKKEALARLEQLTK